MNRRMKAILPRERTWAALTLLCVAALAIFLVWPLFSMLGMSLVDDQGRVGLGGYIDFFSSRGNRQIVYNTVTLGFAVTVCSLLLGGFLAFIVARWKFALAKWVMLLPLITLVIPDVVVAASWILILGRQGLVNMWLEPFGLQVPTLFSWWGLVFVMTLSNYAYAFVAILVGLKSMDHNLEAAANSLGRPMHSVLLRVTCPLMLPSILSGGLLVFMQTIGDFGIPAILGARTPVLSVAAYNAFVSEMGTTPQLQTTLASVLVLMGMTLMILQKVIVDGSQVQMEAGRNADPVPAGRAKAAVGGALIFVIMVLSVLPAVVVLVTAFTPSVGPVLQYGGFTTAHIEYALLRAPQPLYNSVFLATIATVAGTVFSIVAAYLIVKKGSVLGQALEAMVMLPLTIAGTVLGIALIHAFNSPPIVLAGTWVIMALAYFLRRVPISVRAAMGPLHNLRDSIEEASRSLGVSPLKSFFLVVVPVLMPSVAASAVMMWITTLSELSATIVLYHGGMNTMPIEIFQQVDSGRLARASAYSLLLLVTIFTPLFIANKVFRLNIGGIK